MAGIFAFVGPAGPPGAAAGDVHLPIMGRQFVVVGVEARGGPVLDYSDGLAASTTIGPRARVGIHQIITERLSMNLEGAAGTTWLAAHPMAPGGEGASQLAFDFNISMLGRYMAIGPLSGWTFAGGLHYRRAGLEDGSLQQMGLDTRIGYNVWTDDERFFIVELGVHAPVPPLEGVNVPIETTEDVERQAQVPDQWYLPSASIGIQWSF